jgi:hypothetical protein
MGYREGIAALVRERFGTCSPIAVRKTLTVCYS